MTKISILRRKLIRAYHNKENKAYSIHKGYPKDTYFGCCSINEFLQTYKIRMTGFYGKGLRNWWLS